jgi:predicted tellurium resistance membrane protein TerC
MMSADGWIAFATLFAMEVVLGIDNIIFISILAAKLPRHRQATARFIGLGLALIMRIGLLFALTWIMGLTKPLFEVLGRPISGRDLVLILGGLFLIAKATIEIHHMLEGRHETQGPAATTFSMVIAQIVAVDLVFSLDSIITAVGLTQNINIMIAAVIASMIVMVVAAGPVSDFVNRHPTTKMLALAFLVLIGAMLLANGFGVYIPKGYIYAAMVFAVLVEGLNIRAKRARKTATVDAGSVGAVLDELLIRAHRQGGNVVQIAGDETGVARVWHTSSGGALVEARDLPAIVWRDLAAVLETYEHGKPLTLDGETLSARASVAPPDARPAAVVVLAKA